MARFQIEIRDDVLEIGDTWSKERVRVSELDDFIAAIRAAGAFALANADLPKPANKEPVAQVAEPEAAE